MDIADLINKIEGGAKRVFGEIKSRKARIEGLVTITRYEGYEKDIRQSVNRKLYISKDGENKDKS